MPWCLCRKIQQHPHTKNLSLTWVCHFIFIFTGKYLERETKYKNCTLLLGKQFIAFFILFSIFFSGSFGERDIRKLILKSTNISNLLETSCFRPFTKYTWIYNETYNYTLMGTQLWYSLVHKFSIVW